ncbi:DUF4185 domain-containing protein [Mycolicibacterium brumae]|uniref:DUF4185 domain-containing protein n=1 Tax=Mycolicibacterium brumae TaxID=85968 RepID=A0A2G5P561_9MYCO|nr:DUF4185 domain-containing protein [Mycolicibacterium brumae]MCV7194695.1 DUF4185 domain-containing protein [Mycolicibacterium brumae]PIB73472.1 DUF4185 domain-containing protein [Mycolicibacterium brumae]RWA15202.1 hypothetical protein MBRU_11330 [Mycolicibacterium brumae DSM 44177]
MALGVGAAMTTGAGIALANDGSGSSSSSSSGSTSGGDSSPSGASTSSDSTGSVSTTGSTSGQQARSTRPSLGDQFRKAINSAVSGASESRRSTSDSSAAADKATSATSPSDSSSRSSRWQARIKQSQQVSKPTEAPAAKVEAPAEAPDAPAPQPQGDTTPPAGTPAVAPKAPQLSDIADRVTKRFQERAATLTTVVEKPLVASSDKPAGSPDPASAVERVTSRKSESAVRVYSGPAPELVRGADGVTARVSKLADVDAAPLSGAFTAASKVVDSVSAPVTAFVTSASTPPQLANLLDLGEIAKPAASAAATVVSSLLVVAGLSPLAGTGPALPAQSPLAWALAAFARRESEKEISEDDALQSAVDGESNPPGDQPLAQKTYDVQLAAATTTTNNSSPGPAPKPDVPGSLTARQVGDWITGNGSGSGPTDGWWVAGTDLGIMWDSGYTLNGKPVVYTLFGDTFQDTGMKGDWRNNVLFRTTDTDLTNGITFDDAIILPGGDVTQGTWWHPLAPGQRVGAGQIIRVPDDSRFTGTTYTLIPTAGIAVPDARDANGEPVGTGPNGAVQDSDMTQYATVMSVKKWGDPGKWTTNWSAIAVSTDGGKTWNVDPTTIRYASGNDANWQQNALVYGDPKDDQSYVHNAAGEKTNERYVYVYGTPAGRQGSAYLARVPEKDITELDKYEYYAGGTSPEQGTWTTDQSKAVVVFDSMEPLTSVFPESGILGFFFSPVVAFLKLVYPAGFKPGGTFAKGGQGNVSEISVQYNEYLDKYVVMYTDGGNNVVMKVSDTPQGEWSDSIVVERNVAGWYAPMIHPLSGTGGLASPDTSDGAQYLYYNLSNWNSYNVRVKQVDLSTVKSA